jgi:hypothetical protein
MDDTDRSAALEVDMAASIRPGLDAYRDALAAASHDFVVTNQENGGMWIALVVGVAEEVANLLHGLRDRPEARDLFDAILVRELESHHRTVVDTRQGGLYV